MVEQAVVVVLATMPEAEMLVAWAAVTAALPVEVVAVDMVVVLAVEVEAVMLRKLPTKKLRNPRLEVVLHQHELWLHKIFSILKIL